MPERSAHFTPFQKLILYAVALVAVGWVAYQLRALIMPLVLSFLFAYLLNPVVDRLESLVRKRSLAILLIYILFFGGIYVAVRIAGPKLMNEWTDLSTNFPIYYEQFKSFLLEVQFNLEEDFDFIEQFNIMAYVQQYSSQAIIAFTKALPKFLISALSFFTYLAFVPFFLYFFLLEGPDIRMGMFKLIPNRYFEMAGSMFYHVGWKVAEYLRGIMFETLAVGAMTTLFLFAFGVDYALLLGVIAGITNLIPYVGPVFGAVPAMILLYIKTNSVDSVLLLAGVYAFVQLIDSMLLKPIIFSQSVDVHPLLILIAIILGGGVFGVWGLLLAVPVVGVVKVVAIQMARQVKRRKAWAGET